VLGEEAVARHDVTVEGDDIVVTVVEPLPEQVRSSAYASLDRGVDAQYNGQIARDSLRLLHAGADPIDVIWHTVARTLPRTEYGWNHSFALTTDCMTAVGETSGDERLTPVAQAISAMAESELRRPVRPRPVPMTRASEHDFSRYCELVEEERVDDADALLTGALLNGLGRADAARWLIQPVCDHHLDFGHGAIYAQKAFEMLDHVGWEHAPSVLPHAALMQIVATREDRLPYARPFMRAVNEARLGDRWRREVDPQWAGRDDLVTVLLGDDLVAGVRDAANALDNGAGIGGVLDAVSLAASRRMLQHDLDHEIHPDVTGYGWLDITHSLTYANAARWAWEMSPGEHTARLAMFTVFHVVDAGRYAKGRPAPPVAAPTMLLSDAMSYGDPQAAVAAAFAEPPAAVADALVRGSLDDRSGALIVVAHHIKTARAAVRESATLGSPLPMAATCRFLAAPARQRFVGQAVKRARHFLTTGAPPPR
jgi:hypothetical protein